MDRSEQISSEQSRDVISALVISKGREIKIDFLLSCYALESCAMLLFICDSVFFVSNPWMNDFTCSSDDNALVANFAFPAPLRDESLLAPFDID